MIKLIGRSPCLAKDQLKADAANKFIGRGSPASSTDMYRQCFGALANCGAYTAADLVFISAEGNRRGRISPDFDEIALAVAAGARFITDGTAERSRHYNVGERELCTYLHLNGYADKEANGWALWSPRTKIGD
jgi:hypothetical protein